MAFTSLPLHFKPSHSLHIYKTIHGIQSPSMFAIPFPQNPRFSTLSSSSPSIACKFTASDTKPFLRQLRLPRKPVVRTCASKEESQPPDGEEPISVRNGKIAIASAITIVLAVVNRVLYKLALVPMKEYPFFMAQVTTFGYVIIYFSILYFRNRAGVVTKEMLDLPKSSFMSIGILEALGVAAGMSAGAMLPGPAIPILSQTFLVWQLIFSCFILGRQYSLHEVLGCLLVAAGVVVAVASGSNETQLLSQVEFLWPALMIASSAFQAAASIIKEFVFIDAEKRLEGKPVDIFVVNSFGSGFQALFVLLLLPFLSSMRGIPFSELPLYLRSGAGCFMNIGADITGCEGAPLLPLLYITINLAFNISVLYLVKISSAVVSSLAATLSVPIAIYVLTLPLPYMPQGESLSPYFIFGSAILVLGLVLYNLPRPADEGSKTI
ncbi:protein CLT2, chloroplastic isoform X1 [Magnolia sinica]|uniref:protein CLT2, chloroplastic isoform X1 n=1 Tax=Magnolia sinica TaxID=86752 RepID=UPI00265971F9|nr:protein CLT2, chloroplastic isoform X1 [Magnolia sinica]